MARTFQSKGGWVTLCQNEGTYQNTMLFLSPVVGCLLKKKALRGSQAPQDLSLTHPHGACEESCGQTPGPMPPTFSPFMTSINIQHIPEFRIHGNNI